MAEEFVKRLRESPDLSTVNLETLTDSEFQTVVAVMMLEVAHADGEYTEDERRALLKIFAAEFGIADETSGHIVEVADFLVRNSDSKEKFYQKLRNSLSPVHRGRILQFLVQISKADGFVEQAERLAIQSLARKIGATDEEFRAATSG